MLNEDADEALQGAEGGPVEHHGAVLLPVFAHVGQPEALGQVVVHLDGAELPLPPQGVLHHEVQLGAVEGGVPLLHRVPEPGLGRRLLNLPFRQGPLGLVPHVLVAFRVPHPDPGPVVLKPQGGEDLKHQVQDPEELPLHLLGGAEDVGVVLGEAPNPCEAKKLPRLLVAVDGAELGSLGEAPGRSASYRRRS